MPTNEPRPEDTPLFRSPKRSLALSFRLSRERWKAKATSRLQQIKAFRVRVRDLQISRDLWKDKALHLQRQLEELQGQPSAGLQTDSQPVLLDPEAAAAPAEPPGAPADQPSVSVQGNASAKKKRRRAVE